MFGKCAVQCLEGRCLLKKLCVYLWPILQRTKLSMLPPARAHTIFVTCSQEIGRLGCYFQPREAAFCLESAQFSAWRGGVFWNGCVFICGLVSEELSCPCCPPRARTQFLWPALRKLDALAATSSSGRPRFVWKVRSSVLGGAVSSEKAVCLFVAYPPKN